MSALLNNPDPVVRRIALRQLADEADETDIPTLLAGLDDEDVHVRREAALALHDWDSPAVASALCQRLEDEALYDVAAQSLSAIQSAESAEVVLPWTTHANPKIALAALRALRELRLPSVLQPALAAIQSPDAPLRLEGVAVLGWLRELDALPALAHLATTDPHPEIRAAAIGTLGMQASATLLPTLLSGLQDSHWLVREAAAQTLGKGGYVAAEAGLLHACQDPWWQVRLQAVRALGKIRALLALPVLGTILLNDVSNLRKEAAIALGEIRHPDAIALLLPALKDVDPDVRKLTRLALQTLDYDPSLA